MDALIRFFAVRFALVGGLFACGSGWGVTNGGNLETGLSPPHEKACETLDLLPDLKANIAAIHIYDRSFHAMCAHQTPCTW